MDHVAAVILEESWRDWRTLGREQRAIRRDVKQRHRTERQKVQALVRFDLECGHRSHAYATDMRSGERTCMDCYMQDNRQ